MELEFNGTRLSGYHLTVNTTLFSEETLESIVPDACPDILHILSTNAMVCLRAKETREGHLEARGAVYAQVLYVPEGEEGVRHIEVSIPFTCGLDHSGVSADSVLHAVPRVVRADARMLNPRKVYVRAELALKVACYQPYQKKLLSHCGAGVEYGLQEKREDCRLCTIKTVQSKTFTFSDDLVLPGSKPDLEELLCVRVTAACAESKVIGSRLIFKGQAVAEALYRSAEGQLSTASFELPFSQLMDVADTAEEAECDFDIVLNELTCHADREDPRLISLSVSLIAQAVLRETQSVTLLSDLYSTSYTLSAEFQEEELCRSGVCDSVRQELREVIEVPVPAGSVIDSAVGIGSVDRGWEGTLLRFSANVCVSILYQGEDGEYYAVSRVLPAACQLEAQGECRYDVSCRAVGERYLTPTSAGIEVRLTVDFLYRAEQQETIRSVAGASLDEGAPCETGDRPSIVLRMAEPEEELWEIAKAYLTTMDEIRQANDLPDHGAIGGRMLLIPKKR